MTCVSHCLFLLWVQQSADHLQQLLLIPQLGRRAQLAKLKGMNTKKALGRKDEVAIELKVPILRKELVVRSLYEAVQNQ